MRTETLGSRTWLLAAIAGWALLVWVLALFGLGGQIRPLPDDPSLVAPLPQLPRQVPERLGPLGQYSNIAARPLFSPNRQPQPFFISGDGNEAAKSFDFILTSVLITPKLQMAIVQPAAGGEGIRFRIGEASEAMPGWRLSQLDARSAVFEGPEGQRTLELRVFDGNGGQAPTVMVPPPAATGGSVPRPPASVENPNPVPGNPGRSTQVLPASAAPTPDPTMPPGAEQPALTTEQQMDAIRQRIEARRAQLRQQGQSPSPPNKTK